MTTYYVSAAGSNSNNGLSTGAPFLTIAHAVSVMVAGDTCLMNGGDTFTETISPPAALSGSSGSPTTFGAYGAGRPLIRNPGGAGANPCVSWYAVGGSYYTFNDLDLSTASFVAGGGTAITGEHIVETDSSGVASTTHIAWNRCYFHDVMNCAVQAYLGPTPRSAAGNGTPIGTTQDDSDWTYTNCEFFKTGNSIMIHHGSRLTLRTCHLHRWGESSAAMGKHGVYGHSVGAIYDSNVIHNDEAAVNTNSGPSQGSAISGRVTGATIVRNIIHDTNMGAIFWYDNVKGVTLIIANRMFNLYGAFYFAAVTDTGPAYTWTAGSVPVDKFVIIGNTVHVRAGVTAMFDWSDASAVYTGGLVIENNTLLGPYTYGINGNDFVANSGVTGALVEKNNTWYPDGGALTLRWNGTNHTLASWQGTTISGNLQGAGSLGANPSLGSAPAGSPLRALTPYMTAGVVNTPGDNALVGSTDGAPDYYPPSGSNVLNAGTASVDAAATYTAGGAAGTTTIPYFYSNPNIGAVQTIPPDFLFMAC